MASIKVKQDDLRRLMKERRENAKVKIEKIDSPFAKYNSIGHLLCSICNVNVKNNSLWGPHVAGKAHKDRLAKHKKGNSEKDLKNAGNIGVKRKADEDLSKKVKIQATSTIDEKPSVSSLNEKIKSSLLAGYSSDESENEESKPAVENQSLPASNNPLPEGFFDSAPNNVPAVPVINSQPEEEMSVPKTSESLPEGFFDDPILDAKARNIEYKDPAEEEWEKFQKSIAEEDNVSKTIIEEDLEESILERDITQIDEQMHHWERAKNLQSLAEDVVQKVTVKDNGEGDSGNTDEELEDDDLLDWRSKGVKKL